MIAQVRSDSMKLMTLIRSNALLKYVFPFNYGWTVGYTIVSVKQERILEELDDEAKNHIIRGPRTGANS